VHEMLHVNLDGVAYVSMASAGGHLRATKKYEDGWFFGYALVAVKGEGTGFQIKELKSPHGHGRVTGLEDWGVAGLVKPTSGATTRSVPAETRVSLSCVQMAPERPGAR
jgi:hypothetical protein